MIYYLTESGPPPRGKVHLYNDKTKRSLCGAYVHPFSLEHYGVRTFDRCQKCKKIWGSWPT